MAIKYKKWPQTTPNGHKIYQHFPFKGPPKIHPNWDFWYESKPSGNPGDLISIAVVNLTRINDKNIFEGMLQSLQAVPSFCIDLINQFLPPWMVRRCCRQLTASLPSLPSTYIQQLSVCRVLLSRMADGLNVPAQSYKARLKSYNGFFGRDSWGRFYKYPFRSTIFRSDFYIHILDKFPSKNNNT
jgi:hypothetical protein